MLTLCLRFRRVGLVCRRAFDGVKCSSIPSPNGNAGAYPVADANAESGGNQNGETESGVSGFPQTKRANHAGENIFSQLIEFYCSKGTNLITKYEDWSSYDKRKFGLGLSSIQPHIQGYLFDYFESEGRIILILGFDGADGTRFISPVEIPFYVVEGAQRHFGVNKSSVNNMDGVDYSIQEILGQRENAANRRNQR